MITAALAVALLGTGCKSVKPTFHTVLIALDADGKVIKSEEMWAPDMSKWHTDYIKLPEGAESAAFVEYPNEPPEHRWLMVRSSYKGNYFLAFTPDYSTSAIPDEYAPALREILAAK